MGDNGEGLTLEKLKIDDRLIAVEAHIRENSEHKLSLMKSFENLSNTVKSIETTLFGQNGQLGLVQKIDAFLKVAEGIKTVLTKIFVSICSAMVFAAMPTIFKYLAEMLAKHAGG